MPEACFLCLDSTEFMRNGDQFPNRLLAEQEAASLLVNAKVQVNPENTIGFLTMGGHGCTVHETLTSDIERVMASLTNVSIGGVKCHLARALQVASLALSHRSNPRSEKRVVAFIGTPLADSEKELDALAKKLRKDDVAVDIVAFGVESNVPLLENFISKVNKQNNSRFLSIESGANMTDALMSSTMFLGEGAGGASGAGSGEGGNASGGFEFGVDPFVDADLAMALRLSMEDEQRRQAAAAQEQQSASASPPAVAPTETATAAAPAPATETSRSGGAPDLNADEADAVNNLTEEEMIARAIQLSMMDEGAQAPEPVPVVAAQPPAPEGSGDNVDEDEDFQRALLMSLENANADRNAKPGDADQGNRDGEQK